ncbi:hypothetical protein EGW67_02895 [Enterococcus faecium]|nr:hypothetical protein [Enterococcus faecium]PQF82608.1 hypothetical protein CUS59_12520 [Enterococcus faecium]PQG45790.1 hypothetical protein CUS36_08670 [Enterococcus faecium]ROY59223.1 hypothetical protein EGW67_02895 [Enterococcus faecium]
MSTYFIFSETSRRAFAICPGNHWMVIVLSIPFIPEYSPALLVFFFLNINSLFYYKEIPSIS